MQIHEAPLSNLTDPLASPNPPKGLIHCFIYIYLNRDVGETTQKWGNCSDLCNQWKAFVPEIELIMMEFQNPNKCWQMLCIREEQKDMQNLRKESHSSLVFLMCIHWLCARCQRFREWSQNLYKFKRWEPRDCADLSFQGGKCPL